jgi:hypothetical protein
MVIMNHPKLGFGRAKITGFLFLTLAPFLFEANAMGASTTIVTLNGTAQGGVLSLYEVLTIGAGFASVTTTQGESTESVLNRLADEVCRSDSFNWGRPLQPRPSYVRVTGNQLTLPFTGLQYGFSGSDKGFVSVKPVLSVSGSYDAEKHQVNVSWINPPGQYDAIETGGQMLPPNTTNFVYECDPDAKGHICGGLVRGKRGDVYSPYASIIVKADSQEELDTFPFYMGIAPNWSYWSDSTNADAVKCEQGLKGELDLKVRGDPWDKPLYQIVRTTKGGVQGGVWRRFLGLKPGHTYKVEVRLNTLRMDACTNEWAFSFHAAYDNPDVRGLTEAQMAGQAALPDGSKGSEAGQVALYGPGKTTSGEWRLRSTDQPGPGLKIKNITLPKDVTSITVWLRHSGANSTGVGMDWIKLTDVTK